MAKSSNAFHVLADFENNDLSLLISDHLGTTTKKSLSKTPKPTKKPLALSKSPKPTKKPLAPAQLVVNALASQLKQAKQANPACGCDDLENNCVVERGFFGKFGVSEDGEFEKPEIHGGLRSKSRGGPRRTYRSSSRLFCRPGREYVNQETEDYAVMMSSKYRLFDRHSLCSRSNGGKNQGFGRWNWGTVMDDQELEQWSVELANSIEDDMNANQSDGDESDNKEMTLDEYEKVRNEKKSALQAILLELAAKRKDDEDFINEFVIIDAAEADGFQLKG